MATHQGKAVGVIFGPLGDDVPPFYRVALFAVGSHLAAMDVGVAVRAVRSCVREDRLGVALSTGNALVQTSQRIAGLIVIELRHRTNGLPAHRSVAILAGDAEASVRAA